MKKKKSKMLKFFLVVCFSSLLAECKAQIKQQNIKQSQISNLKNAKMSEKFDIETFNKNQQNNSYEFDIKGGHVLQFSYGNGYAEEIIYTDKLFKLTKDFYKNGNIKQKGLTFIKDGFMKGVWQFFESSGNLSHEIDYDSWYKFTWEDVQRFLRENHVNIQQDIINIDRTWKEKEERVWVISYKTTPDKNGNYIRTVTLNGNSVKIQKEEWTRPQRN